MSKSGARLDWFESGSLQISRISPKNYSTLSTLHISESFEAAFVRSFVRLGLHHGLFSRFSSSVFSLSYIAARGGGGDEAVAAASRRRQRRRRRTLNIRLRLHSAKLVHKSAVFRKIPWTLLPLEKKREKNIWPLLTFSLYKFLIDLKKCNYFYECIYFIFWPSLAF